MLSAKQLKEFVIIPALTAIDLCSDSAVQLLLATVAQESLGGEFIKQEEGPALGIYQMEPSTYNVLWDNYLTNKSQLANNILKSCEFYEIPHANEMIWNLRYATMIARTFYLQFPQSLPQPNDIDGIWDYYKLHWNTPAGKATKPQFIENYHRFLGYLH